MENLSFIVEWEILQWEIHFHTGYSHSRSRSESRESGGLTSTKNQEYFYSDKKDTHVQLSSSGRVWAVKVWVKQIQRPPWKQLKTSWRFLELNWGLSAQDFGGGLKMIINWCHVQRIQSGKSTSSWTWERCTWECWDNSGYGAGFKPQNSTRPPRLPSLISSSASQEQLSVALWWTGDPSGGLREFSRFPLLI